MLKSNSLFTSFIPTCVALTFLVMSPVLDYYSWPTTSYQDASSQPHHSGNILNEVEVYSNARLDPKNFLDGPLSSNPATRLRQMLARPGIVVSPILYIIPSFLKSYRLYRLPQASAMESVQDVRWMQASLVCIKGWLPLL